MRGRPKAELALSETEREQPHAWARRRKTAQAQVLALRSRIVLERANGLANQEVAQHLAVTPQTVSKWRRRSLEMRLESLVDAPRPGVPKTIHDAQVDAVITQTLESKPKDATH
jgi:transposase